MRFNFINLKRVTLIIILISILGLVGCFHNIKREDIKPFIWNVSKNNKDNILIGSIHGSDKYHNFFSSEVEDIIKDMDTLAVELDITLEENLNKIKQATYLNEGDSIENYLSNEEIKKLELILNKNTNIDDSMLKNLTPFGVNSLLSSMYNINLTEPGLDLLLIEYAKKNSIEINEIEDIDVKIDNYKKIYTWDYIKNEINSFSEEKFKSKIDQETEVWNQYINSDIEGLEKSLIEFKNTSEAEYKSTIIDRNITMAKKLDNLFIDSKKHVVVLGVLHFIGSDGILELLKKDGYTIERIS